MTGKRSSISVLIAVIVAALAVAAFPASPISAADPVSLTPSADAWVNQLHATTNYGTAQMLRAAKPSAESVIRFKTGAWTGKSAEGLTFKINILSGDASGVIVEEVVGAWTEGSVTWRTRPTVVKEISHTAVFANGVATFPAGALFPAGTINRNAVALRVRSTNAALMMFGSREAANKPRLTLGANATPNPPPPTDVSMKPLADSWANAALPSKTYGTANYLLVDGQTKAEGYLMFDLTNWRGRKYDLLQLQFTVRTAGGSGVSVYRAGTSWTESGLSWNQRPQSMALLANLATAPAAGKVTVDIATAFAGSSVDANRLAVRIVTTNARGFDFSSREGPTAPRLVISAAASATPTPNPTPSPSPIPTPSPTLIPTQSPAPPTAIPPTVVPPTAVPTISPISSVCPSPSPTASPTESPIPSPTPSPTVEPLFYFRGFGTDHGAGLSQWGARGRAQAGQTYDQILSFYYTGILLSAIDGQEPFRVLLSNDFWPTAAEPARVTGLIGGWTSAAFPGTTFPQGSYVEIWPNFPVPPAPDPCAPTPTPSPSTQPQTWTATAYDSAGVPLASVVTNDMTVTASTPDGILQMRHRDRVSKWEQYRGSMRLVADDSGLATINVLPFESYIRGVVPGEMPGGWSLEAVKAQAVAARSYAWARRKPTQMWDLSPVNTQVYGGYLIEHPGADAAIAATANTVMTFNGNVISAVFHTTSGGHTENSEFTFTNSNGNPGNIVGYLRGKPDVDANGRPYDLASPSYDWHTGQFTMSQLNDIYRANIQTDVGDIYSINYERGVSGRVYRVTLVGSTGTKVVSGGRFKNIFNDGKPPGSDLKSALFYLEPVVP